MSQIQDRRHGTAALPSRRGFLRLLGAGLAWPWLAPGAAWSRPGSFRIRAITAGVPLTDADDFAPVHAATVFLRGARETLEAAGYEVQTLRLATQPLPEYLPDWNSDAGLERLEALDRLTSDEGVLCSIGPVITDDVHDPGLAPWATELIRRTDNLSFTVHVASPRRGVHPETARTAAETIRAIAASSPGGAGNFRFAATAFAPAGTPFFPAAWFDSGDSFSLGLESPLLVRDALAAADDLTDARTRLRDEMDAALEPLQARAREVAAAADWDYLGIDVSPAPGLEASIGAAIETLSGEPFGSPSTLAACAVITEALQTLKVDTCGYSGLMLPVLEDEVLARRAAEGRYGVGELLLYSSVCGTGLDVVPLPGDVTAESLADLVLDVAALATRYDKPLSARLFPVPGKAAGDPVSFDNAMLTDSVILPID